MLTLVLDTCTERGLIAIFKGSEPLVVQDLPVGLQSSSLLFPLLEQSLEQLKIAAKDLKLIIVTAGPGSYTGIRVGVAAAKALSFAHQIPIVALSTLDGFTPDFETEYTAIIDAKIGGAYIQTGTLKPKIVTLELLAPSLAHDAVLVTPTVQPLKDKLDKLAPDNRWQWIEKGPDAIQLMRIGTQKYAEGLFSLDGHIDILYCERRRRRLTESKLARWL